jgi:hypothetical protein
MTERQLTMPFPHQDDDANKLAHAIVAKVVAIVHQEAPPDFRWSKSANLELCRVRYAFAAMLRAHLRDHEIRAQREWRTGRLSADKQGKR